MNFFLIVGCFAGECVWVFLWFFVCFVFVFWGVHVFVCVFVCAYACVRAFVLSPCSYFSNYNGSLISPV